MQRTNKPWGYYEDIYRSDNTVFKKIVIYPNHQISVQKHLFRSEFWVIYRGVGNFGGGDSEENIQYSQVSEGFSIHIPKEYLHVIKNESEDKELIFFETQYGMCDEKDIVRYYDPYSDSR